MWSKAIVTWWSRLCQILIPRTFLEGSQNLSIYIGATDTLLSQNSGKQRQILEVSCSTPILLKAVHIILRLQRPRFRFAAVHYWQGLEIVIHICLLHTWQEIRKLGGIYGCFDISPLPPTSSGYKAPKGPVFHRKSGHKAIGQSKAWAQWRLHVHKTFVRFYGRLTWWQNNQIPKRVHSSCRVKYIVKEPDYTSGDLKIYYKWDDKHQKPSAVKSPSKGLTFNFPAAVSGKVSLGHASFPKKLTCE